MLIIVLLLILSVMAHGIIVYINIQNRKKYIKNPKDIATQKYINKLQKHIEYHI